MLATQLSWKATAALAWVLFGGWLLTIEFTELQRDKKDRPGYRFSRRGRRRQDYLLVATGVWLFGIMIFVLI